MRGMFGLVSLLVGVGLLMFIFSKTAIPTAKRGKQAEEEVRQISGRGSDGLAAIDSFEVEGKSGNGTLQSLEVKSVTAGGAMATFYGLAPGDSITAIDGTPLATYGNDEGLAKALISDAYAKQQKLTVKRGSQQIILPAVAAAPAPVPAPTPAADSAAAPVPAPQPAPAPKKSRGIQGQLDDIQNAAGGTGSQDK